MAKSRWAIGITYVYRDEEGNRRIGRVTKKTQALAKKRILETDERRKQEQKVEKLRRKVQNNINRATRKRLTKGVNRAIEDAAEKGITLTYEEAVKKYTEKRDSIIKNVNKEYTGVIKDMINSCNSIMKQIKAIIKDPNLPADVRNKINKSVPWSLDLETELVYDDFIVYDYEESYNLVVKKLKEYMDMMNHINDILEDAKNDATFVDEETGNVVADVTALSAIDSVSNEIDNIMVEVDKAYDIGSATNAHIEVRQMSKGYVSPIGDTFEAIQLRRFERLQAQAEAERKKE